MSGGYVVNNGGLVYYYMRLSGAKFAAAPAAGDFSLALWPGVTWTIGTPVLSTDGTTVVVPLTNDTGATQAIGSGAQITWTGGAKSLIGTTAMRTAGDQVSVTGSISGTTNNANVGTLPGDVDSAAAFTFVATAASLSGGVAANAGVLKIAVDETSQRKNFVGPAFVNQLGSVTFTNLANQQLQVNGTSEYTVLDPAGRLVDMTVTATGGSFNAAVAGGVFVSTDSGCGSSLAAGTLNVGKTVATFTGVSPATLPLYVCYAVNGTDQVAEVTGITAAATLKAPPSINDADVSTSGSLANVVNDGTVIDARIYIPVAVNQFGYGMSLRVINTGSTAADVFAQYIYNDGTLSTQGKVATSVPVGGYVMLDNTQIEAVIGAPSAAKGSNPRVRVIAPTSSLRVQTFMRTNGIWRKFLAVRAKPRSSSSSAIRSAATFRPRTTSNPVVSSTRKGGFGRPFFRLLRNPSTPSTQHAGCWLRPSTDCCNATYDGSVLGSVIRPSSLPVPKPKILCVVGTRPEAIKMAPVIERLKESQRLECRVLVTAQHRKPARHRARALRDPGRHRPRRDAAEPGAQCAPEPVAGRRWTTPSVREQPAAVLAQGDTTSVLRRGAREFPSARAVRACRSRAADRILHEPLPRGGQPRPGVRGSPSGTSLRPRSARDNLLAEGLPDESIYVTGNTVIDALLEVAPRAEGPDLSFASRQAADPDDGAPARELRRADGSGVHGGQATSWSAAAMSPCSTRCTRTPTSRRWRIDCCRGTRASA